MNKRIKKILIITGALILVLIVGAISLASYIFHEDFVKPYNNAISEAKSRAAYLLVIPDKTALDKVGEAGMSETIDNNNHCYTYVFQGAADYLTSREAAVSLLGEAGYYSEPETVIDADGVYKAHGKAIDGWTTQLQVLNNTVLVGVAKNVIENPVSTKTQTGQILISGQVCNI